MNGKESASLFERVAAELRVLGITVRRLPGEYCVNFCYGGEKTARMADDLAQALELGRAMAADKAAQEETTKPPRRRRRRKRTMRKAQRYPFKRRNNRRVRSRGLRKPRGET